MIIHTKQMKKGSLLLWCCYATILGMDYSISSLLMEDAQNEMKDVLKRRGIGEEEVKWTDPKLWGSDSCVD